MTELSDHYMRVRDYARKFSLDESLALRTAIARQHAAAA